MKLKTHKLTVLEESIQVTDLASSTSPEFIESEINNDCYGINRISLPDDATIVDIGANIGIFSIMMSKKLPDAEIHCYEPQMINYQNLKSNIELNGLGLGITANNLAVTKDGRDIVIYNDKNNTGRSSIYRKDRSCNNYNTIKSVTLSSIIDSITSTRESIDYLKIDIEGAEYELFEDRTKQYPSVKHLVS